VLRLHRLALLLLLLVPAPALAQTAAPSPFAYTCGNLLASSSADERAVANMMVFWVVGYMHGALADLPTLQLDAAHHDRSVTDVVAALQTVCPNVPDMPLAEVARNLAADVRKTVQ